MDIHSILTEEQITSIVSIIETRCNMFQDSTDGLFYDPYSNMRGPHALTAAILTGFASVNMNVEGLTSQDVYYGLQNKMCQPELYNENGVFHIYSSNANCGKSKIVQERCKQYNTDMAQKPTFYIIQFAVKCNQLVRLALLLPDSKAQIVDECEFPLR